MSHPFNDQFQVNADVTVTSLSSTVGSGGVPATMATGNEYFYSLQFIGSSILKEGDIAIAGVRYSNTLTADRYILDLNTRYPVTRTFRVNPRFRLSYRETKTASQTQWSARPSMRLSYYRRRNFQLEAEFGGEWISEEFIGGTDDTLGYFFNFGYRLDY